MNQPTAKFSFKKNTGVEALPHPSPVPQQKSKPGRKPSPEVGVRQRQVSAYLAQKEWAKFESRLQGRPASAVLRNLILNFIKDTPAT